jgi:DNA helicase-2/ATP-dependent DNA helicase PcrA
MKKILDNLNSVQQEAVQHIDGPSLIVAGAGSGKTRVLTCKIAWLLQNGVSPHSILALTFTNKAAKEMKARIENFGINTHRLWIGTFHSIFSRILRVEAAATGFNSNYTIYDSADSMSLIRSIIKEMALDDKTYRDRDVQSRISMAKNCLMSPSAYSSSSLADDDVKAHRSKIAEIYSRYFARCRNANAMDFDDLLLYTNILFRDNPDILKKYQQNFRYVLVDEYQDTNVAQYLIVKRLAELRHNITVVGDDAQSIYSFRGARIENILNFKKDYPEYTEYRLEQNYRSTKTIVDAANSLIEKNKSRIKKTCFSEGDKGERIELIKAFTDQEEGLMVVHSIGDVIYRNHADCSKIAILYRTNAQSRILEDSLRRRNIPYRIYGGLSFYQRAEIKDVIAYMRLAVNPADDEALKRIINSPVRGIGSTTMERIQTYAGEKALSLWDVIAGLPACMMIIGLRENTVRKIIDFRNLIESFSRAVATANAFDFASDVIKRSGIMAELKSNKAPEGISRLENVEELLNSIKEYVSGNENQDETPTIAEYLQNVSLITDADRDRDDNVGVSLMTIHSSKGLEFDYVYIVGVEEGLFPGNQSLLSEQSLEEERRLFYVALTRAAVKVHISFSNTRFRHGSLVNALPSRFIGDIDKVFIAGTVSRKSSEQPSPRPTLERKSEIDRPYHRVDEMLYTTESGETARLRTGTKVEHSRFGIGVIVEIESEGDEKKARIDFQESGRKTLLLKYAKLKISGQ